MPATFFMVGPTAIGKSSLAVEVAARCGGEIVGADAFQVYAGFELLTAKPSLNEQDRVPHHLIGTVSPRDTYNVARYLRDARAVLAAIHARGKPALVVGGTGLYVKALTHGLSPLPAGDPTLRAELDTLEPTGLLMRLRALDPTSAETIDPHNKRRLIRALEVCLLTGKPFSAHRQRWGNPVLDHGAAGVCLLRPRADLHHRVTQRIATMFERGVVEEVAAARGSALSETASKMIGWQDIQEHLDGKKTSEECRAQMVVSTRQYAKRQITWFQREKHFEGVDLSVLSDEQAADLLTARVAALAGDDRCATTA